MSLKTLPAECWRAIYGASEACYLGRHFDDGMEVNSKIYTRLQYCINNFFDHPNCDVRALLVENVSFLVEQPEEGQVMGKKGHRINFPKDFTTEIDYWLLDTDIWVLEHVYSMFVAIQEREKNGLGLKAWMRERAEHVAAHPNCLLAKLGPDWMTMERGDFLRSLEELQQHSPYRPK